MYWSSHEALPMLHFSLISTGGTRTSGQANLCTQHCKVPQETSMDEACILAKALNQNVQNLQYEQFQQTGQQTIAPQKV